jgi:hypothetical protein
MTIPDQASSASTDVVQSIWLGRVSVMERLAIASFIANGHPFHLYSYEELEDLPAGAILMDASEVLPIDWVLRDSRGSLAGFSDVFRYKLLLEKGGWWVDTDIVCLQPWDFEDEYVFALEPDLTVGSSVIRVPPASDVMLHAWERSLAFRPKRPPFPRKRLQWMALGPNLLGELVEKCGLLDRAVEPDVFNPIDWSAWDEVLKPNGVTRVDDETKAIHLWNSLWDKAGRDKNATYPHDCLYEQLKRRYLGVGA